MDIEKLLGLLLNGNKGDNLNSKIDYSLAGELSGFYSVYNKIMVDAEMIGYCFKAYCLGVLTEDQEMRQKAMKKLIRLTSEEHGIVNNARQFKEVYENGLKQGMKNIKKKQSENLEKECDHCN